jgi:hypothetical protein
MNEKSNKVFIAVGLTHTPGEEIIEWVDSLFESDIYLQLLSGDNGALYDVLVERQVQQRLTINVIDFDSWFKALQESGVDEMHIIYDTKLRDKWKRLKTKMKRWFK